jgi:hypothetical protein
MKLHDLVAGAIVAALLVACSAAPTAPSGSAGLEGTAAAGVDAASTALPGLEATAAAGVDAANTAVPGLDATAAAAMDTAATAAPGLQATAEAATGMSADEMASMLGQSVTLNGPVTMIMSPMLFQVDDAAYGEDVLVLAPTGSMSIGQGQQVEITGVVQTFDVAALEQSLGVDIDENMVSGLAGRSVVVADQVNTTSS